MSFPLNKRVNGLKIFNKVGTTALCNLSAVDIVRTNGDTTKLTLVEPLGVTKVSKIQAVRFLPQLSRLRPDQFTQASKQPKYLKYVVIIDVRSCFFGRVAKVVSRFGGSVNVDLLCDGTKLVLKGDQFRSVRDKDMLFDYNPITQESGKLYDVEDWVGEAPNKPYRATKATCSQVKKKSSGKSCVVESPITYKIQYATSDGKVFGSTWEVNQYVDEQNKLRLHQKKMILLKAMAEEVGLEFEVNGSSIVLK